MSTAEVIVGEQRRRRWSPSEKRAIVQETDQPGMSVSSVARKYSIHANQVFRWRRLVEEGALSAVGADESVVPASEFRELKKKVALQHTTSIHQI